MLKVGNLQRLRFRLVLDDNGSPAQQDDGASRQRSTRSSRPAGVGTPARSR
jgi:hypothetical protein